MSNPEAESAAYRVARETAYRAAGGGLAHGGTPGQSAAPAQFGLVASDVPGRTDRHNMDLPSGSYVMPADIVSGLGEGNSLAGSAVIDRMLHSAPYGVQMPQPGKGVMPRKDFAAGRPGAQMSGHPPAANGADGSAPQDGGFARGGAPGPAGQGDESRMLPEHEGWDDDKVPVVVAGGESILHPHTIAYHPSLGGLSRGPHTQAERKQALARGHAALDTFVKSRRAKDIKTLSRLPGPAK